MLGVSPLLEGAVLRPRGARVHFTLFPAAAADAAAAPPRGAPAVVLLHPFLCSGESFANLGFVDALCDAGFAAICVDARAHGRTGTAAALAALDGQEGAGADADADADADAGAGGGAADFSPETLAGDIAAVLDALNIERAALVGYSFGARLAYVAAGVLGDARVSALVAGGTPPGPTPPEIRAQMRATYGEHLLGPGGTPSFVKWIETDLASSSAGNLPKGKSLFEVFFGVRRTAAESLDGRALMQITEALWDIPSLDKFTGPALFYAGGKEPPLVHEIFRAATAARPDTAFVVVDSKNHAQCFAAFPQIFPQVLDVLSKGAGK